MVVDTSRFLIVDLEGESVEEKKKTAEVSDSDLLW